MHVDFDFPAKKAAFFLSALVLILAIGLATAFNSGGPPVVMGHSVEELDLGPIIIDIVNGRIGIGAAPVSNELEVTGNILATGDISSTGDILATGDISSTGNILATGDISSTGNILATGDVCTGAGNCLNAAGPAGSVPLQFEVYNSNTTTWACVTKDLEDYCGDADGCTIRAVMHHELDGSDQVRIIDEHIYMEQPALSKNRRAGRYGWTRQGGGGDYSWITGMGGRYTMFNPWSWIYMYNYKHDNCAGQVGTGSAYADPYTFTFMTHPHVRTNLFVYDNPA